MELHKAKVEVDCESIYDESEHETKKRSMEIHASISFFSFFLAVCEGWSQG